MQGTWTGVFAVPVRHTIALRGRFQRVYRRTGSSVAPMQTSFGFTVGFRPRFGLRAHGECLGIASKGKLSLTTWCSAIAKIWKSSLLLALTYVATTSALPSPPPPGRANEGGSCPVKPGPNWRDRPLAQIVRLIDRCAEGRPFCRELIGESCEVVSKTRTVTPQPATVKVIRTITDPLHQVTKTITNHVTSTLVKPPTRTTTLHETATLTHTVPLTITDRSTVTVIDIWTVLLSEPDYMTVTIPATTVITNTVTDAITDFAAATIAESFKDTTTETLTNTITDWSTAYVPTFITEPATAYITNLYTQFDTATITNYHTETVTLSFTDTATATATDNISSTTTQEVDVTTTDTQSETTIQTDFKTSTNTVPVTVTDYALKMISIVQTHGVTTTAVVTVAPPAKRDVIEGWAAAFTPSALRGIHVTYLSSACSILIFEDWTSTIYSTKTLAQPTVYIDIPLDLYLPTGSFARSPKP
ncbi:hypothetical protein N7490_001757 [Penicillium lividum]|nr:hypothetical protein N7490_001757 [Penicillium lividum]